MTENQIRLFKLEGIVPAEDSPAFISGGELFKDEASDSILARLMLDNASGKEISSVRLLLIPLDREGREIDFDTEYERRGPFIGEGPHKLQEIMLPFMTLSFRAEVLSAAYADGSTWEKAPQPEVSSASGSGSDSASKAKKADQTEKKGLVSAAVEKPHDDHPADKKQGGPVNDPFSSDKGFHAAPKPAEQSDEAASAGGGFSFRKLLVFLIPAVLILSGLAIIFTGVFLPERRYANAVELFNSGRFEEAIPALEAMNGYKESAQYISIAESALAYQAAVESYEKGDYAAAYTAFTDLKGFGDSAEWAARSAEEISAIAYNEADALLKNGRLIDAANAFYAIKDYSDSWDRCFAVWGLIAGRRSISAGSHTVCLTDGGNIMTAGDNSDGELNLSGWQNVAEVYAGNGFTVGLMPDGTVVAAGDNTYGQCDVEDWQDMVYVSAGYWSTAGIRADGTVVIAGRECDVAGWSNVRALSLSIFHAVGLLSDGTVVAAEIRDSTGTAHDYGQSEISGWKDIVAVSAGYGFTIGLKKDGTVVAAGDNTYGQCDVEDWEDIVAISANFKHVIGLKADGTVVAAGWNENGECDVEDWEDIVAISTGTSHTIGLKSDGTVVAAGNNKDGRCDVEDWDNIRLR